MKIVGLVGPKRSGKDTAAAALVEQRGYARVGFADAVKDLALQIDPQILAPFGNLRDVVTEQGWEQAKTYTEVRRFLQELGTGVRDTTEDDVWIKAWFKRAFLLADEGKSIVVPDVRFENEADYLRGGDNLLIRIVRPGIDLSDGHVSETEQTGIWCDVEVTNDGTPEQLHAAVLAAVDEWSS